LFIDEGRFNRPPDRSGGSRQAQTKSVTAALIVDFQS
jgi:hypothetical protein